MRSRRHQELRASRPAKAALILSFCLLLLCQLAASAQVKPSRRILILYESAPESPLAKLVDQGLRSALDNSPYRVEFYREYMETAAFPDPADQQIFRDFYIRKYQHRKPDVIIAVGPNPLQFMTEVHQESFPGVPVIFCLPNRVPGGFRVDGDFTGVQGDIAPSQTLDVALRLRPNTRHVVVVVGTTPFDKQQLAAIKEELKTYESRLDVSYVTDLTMPDLLERVRHLPSHTIILLGAVGGDAAGNRFTSDEAGPMIVAAANAPIFTLNDRLLRHGEVGGDVSDAVEQGRVSGNMAQRILSGEKPQDIPAVKDEATYIFDWQALKRWGMSEKNLPAGSIVLNRQPGLWETYKQFVLAGFVVLLAQTMAILGLLWERQRRRKIEAELRRSEQKFSKTFRQSPLALAITRASDCRFMEINDTFEEQAGWRRDEVTGLTPLDLGLLVDPEQRVEFQKQLLLKGNVHDFEVRVRRKDGNILTVLCSAESIEVNGERCVLSVAADITQRKEAEVALSGLSCKLLEAQEGERTRIARELHDDISQRLAVVAVNLQTLRQESSAGNGNHRLDEVCELVSGLESDIQALSHRLHSSRLEYLGLQVACAGFCKELSEQQRVKINFRAEGIPEALPNETSLCLFRVMQEALHNAVKHSGVNEFDVRLTGVSNEIALMVRDFGVGFDPSNMRNGHGLGLISMKERLRMVDGHLSIKSSPQGTTILARAPVNRRLTTTGTAA